MPTLDELHEDPVIPTTDESTWRRGPITETSREKLAERRAQMQAANKTQISMRLDQDLIAAYKDLAQGGSYQVLMRQALRDWLEARGVSAMVKEELRPTLEALKQAIPSKTSAAAGE